MRFVITAVAAIVLACTAAATAQSYTGHSTPPFHRGETIDPETPAQTQARVAREARRRRILRVDPYVGCPGRPPGPRRCGRYAIPTPSVECESGGGNASSNLYGNLGYSAGMTKWEQDVAAWRIMRDAGYYEGWLRWESGCAGWPWGY